MMESAGALKSPADFHVKCENGIQLLCFVV